MITQISRKCKINIFYENIPDHSATSLVSSRIANLDFNNADRFFTYFPINRLNVINQITLRDPENKIQIKKFLDEFYDGNMRVYENAYKSQSIYDHDMQFFLDLRKISCYTDPTKRCDLDLLHSYAQKWFSWYRTRKELIDIIYRNGDIKIILHDDTQPKDKAHHVMKLCAQGANEIIYIESFDHCDVARYFLEKNYNITQSYVLGSSNQNMQDLEPRSPGICVGSIQHLNSEGIEMKLPIHHTAQGESMNNVVKLERWLDLTKFSFFELQNIFHHIDEEQNAIRDNQNFPYFTPMLLDVLEYCKNNASIKPKLIELGCGKGASVWKALLAGCQVYAVDLRFKEDEIEKNTFESYIKSIVPKEIYRDNLKIISNSIYELPEELNGEFDIVYSYQLISILPPKGLQEFANIVNGLLRPGGIAFIAGDSTDQMLVYENCAEAVSINKKNNCIAPGYMLVGLDCDDPINIFKLPDQERLKSLSSLDIKACYLIDSCEVMNNLEEEGSYESLGMYQFKISDINDHIIKVFGTLDVEDLNKFFQNANMQTLDNYYFDILSTEKKYDSGFISAIKVEKPIGDLQSQEYSLGFNRQVIGDQSEHEEL